MAFQPGPDHATHGSVLPVISFTFHSVPHSITQPDFTRSKSSEDFAGLAVGKPAYVLKL